MTIISNPGTEHRGPFVSAVPALRNEERHIDAVLKSVLQQENPNFEPEIIVVDGSSSDSKRGIVRRIAAGTLA
jgi:glycosyltransferase involved in cell wall biosynthesis